MKNQMHLVEFHFESKSLKVAIEDEQVATIKANSKIHKILTIPKEDGVLNIHMDKVLYSVWAKI